MGVVVAAVAANNNQSADLPAFVPSDENVATAAETAEEPGVSLVRSPMPGTFYGASEPRATPFVNEGDRVTVGQVLRILEAMKLMNKIESEVAGEVLRVFYGKRTNRTARRQALYHPGG